MLPPPRLDEHMQTSTDSIADAVQVSLQVDIKKGQLPADLLACCTGCCKPDKLPHIDRHRHNIRCITDDLYTIHASDAGFQQNNWRQPHSTAQQQQIHPVKANVASCTLLKTPDQRGIPQPHKQAQCLHSQPCNNANGSKLIRFLDNACIVHERYSTSVFLHLQLQCCTPSPSIDAASNTSQQQVEPYTCRHSEMPGPGVAAGSSYAVLTTAQARPHTYSTPPSGGYHTRLCRHMQHQKWWLMAHALGGCGGGSHICDSCHAVCALAYCNDLLVF